MMDFFFNKRRNLTNRCIKNCKSLEEDRELLSRFTFPKDFSRCAVWLNNCEIPHLKTIDTALLYRNYLLCLMHFENCMFGNKQNNCLKSDAIPTLFESTSHQHTIENYADDNHEIE